MHDVHWMDEHVFMFLPVKRPFGLRSTCCDVLMHVGLTILSPLTLQSVFASLALIICNQSISQYTGQLVILAASEIHHVHFC